jgi:putative oxidoreductase
MAEFVARLQQTRLTGAGAWIPTVVRVLAGAFFVSTGMGKFLDHAKEVHDFRGFEVPWPEVAVPVVGTIEVLGGLLLVIGFLTRPAAFVLALNMVGALATAGRVEGGSFHLVYAPTLLVLMLFVCWAGPGRLALDTSLAAKRRAPDRPLAATSA